MLSLLDFTSPQVYVISEKHYEEILEKRRKRERADLELRKDYHLKQIKEIDDQIEKLG